MVRAFFNLDRLLAAGGVRVLSPNGVSKFVRMSDGLEISLPSVSDPYLDLNGDLLSGVHIPDRLDKSLIEGFTSYDNVDTGKRPIGEYALNTARSVVSNHTGQFRYHIKYAGKELEDIAELHRRFCEGLIWPVGDHEKEMAPPPFRHFRDVLRELWQIIRRDVSLKLRNA